MSENRPLGYGEVGLRLRGVLMCIKKALILASLFVVLPQRGFAIELDSIRENTKGVESLVLALERLEQFQKEAQKQAPKGAPPPEVKLDPEELTPALNHFIKALGVQPQNKVIRFNLALILQLQGHLKKALIEYELLQKGAVDQFKFNVVFNKAIIYTKLNDFKKALENYQVALEVEPDSQEVKTNIELLWQNSKGSGGEDEDKSKDDKSGKDKKEDTPGKETKPQKKKKPKDLSKSEIKKILNELKNQEKKIRAKEINEKLKESPREKDW